MYRVGLPLWKVLARLGVPVFFRVEVAHDAEAGVYIARSPDLRGLVAEAKTKAELIRAMYDCGGMLLEEALSSPPKKRPFAAWTGEVVAA